MGLWNFITGQFIDVIEWVDESRDTLVWKFPDQDHEIKMGAQLTVRESQVAIFINEGQMADVFPPGRYELVTRNMPILTSLKSWKHGFDSPFKADVYFVNTREFANMKWGTRQPIMVSDPEFSLVQMRAFGSFNFRIQDAAIFFRQFAGTDPNVTTDELLEHFRSMVVTEFSTAMKKSGKTLVEINARAHELGEELLPILQPDFQRVGLELTRFLVESISLPEEVQSQLTEQDMEVRKLRRTMGVENEMELQNLMGKANLSQNVADMEKFLKFQAGSSMDNPGSEGANNDMMKMMMQMQMAQQMTQGDQEGQASGEANTEKTGGDEEGMTREQVLATLKELGDLKEAGILTEEEFNEKKKDMLGRL